MKFTQQIIMWILLSELIQRRLEIVGLHRQVVVVRSHSTLSFIQISQSLWVRSSMIHIVTQEVRATSQFHHCHRISILRINIRTTMIGRHHTTTQFTSEVWDPSRPPQRGGVPDGVQCRNGIHRPHILSPLGGAGRGCKVKGLIVIACCLFDAPFPESVSIVTIKGQHLSEGHRSRQLWPTSTRIERQVEAYLQSDFLQGHQVLSPTTIFIIKLSSNHWPTIFPLESLQLGEDLTIQSLHKAEEHRILVPRLTALRKHPVWDSTVSHFSMTERP